MKYKISDVYLKVNRNNINVGVVLGQEDKPCSPFSSEYITCSEYEKGLKEFRYGRAQIDDLVYHVVGRFVNFVAVSPIEQKWIDELKLMGYDVSKLKYEVAE